MYSHKMSLKEYKTFGTNLTITEISGRLSKNRKAAAQSSRRRENFVEVIILSHLVTD